MALVVKAMIIGAIVSSISYTVGLAVTGNLNQASAGGALKALFFGAVSGAVTCGIGSLFSSVSGVDTAFATALGGGKSAGVIFVGAACHAVAQGALSMVQGGKFLTGATAGILGHLGGAAWGEVGGNFAGSDVGTVAFGALSGGVGAELTGGNFWQGAVTGGIVAGLNTAMHKMGDDGDIDPPGKKKAFIKKGSLDNSKTALDLGGGTFGALESTVAPDGMWLGKNGKYYSKAWGGNGATGSRAGALKAGSNYKLAGRGVAVISAGVGVVETINGYQMDGGNFGYNAQSAAASSAGSMLGGWAGAEAGAAIGAGVGVWFGGVGAVPGAIIGGFIGGLSGGYVGGAVGQGSVNYYHNK